MDNIDIFYENYQENGRSLKRSKVIEKDDSGSESESESDCNESESGYVDSDTEEVTVQTFEQLRAELESMPRTCPGCGVLKTST